MRHITLRLSSFFSNRLFCHFQSYCTEAVPPSWPFIFPRMKLAIFWGIVKVFANNYGRGYRGMINNIFGLPRKPTFPRRPCRRPAALSGVNEWLFVAALCRGVLGEVIARRDSVWDFQHRLASSSSWHAPLSSDPSPWVIIKAMGYKLGAWGKCLRDFLWMNHCQSHQLNCCCVSSEEEYSEDCQLSSHYYSMNRCWEIDFFLFLESSNFHSYLKNVCWVVTWPFRATSAD